MKRFPSKDGSILFFAILMSLMFGMFAQLAIPDNAGADARDVENFWINEYGKVPAPSRAVVAAEEPISCTSEYIREKLAKAQPDECFLGIGNPVNRTGELGWLTNYPTDLTQDEIAACLSTPVPVDPDDPEGDQYESLTGYGQPKVNQAYVWGLTKSGDKLWFGTFSNTLCSVYSGYLNNSTPSLNDSYVCEGSSGSDFRPPRLFNYDLKAKKLTEVTQDVLATDRSYLTGGVIRSAGALNGVVFLAGSSGACGVVDGVGYPGLGFFAFDGETGEYLGKGCFPHYNNVRQWRVIEGQLYVGVAYTPYGDDDPNVTGKIFRWTGSKADPFSFETVAEIKGDPVYITPHEGRIFVSTWPGLDDYASIWMSPEIGDDGMLTASDAKGWQNVWNIGEYEPEPAAANTIGGGAMMSYKGHLYWGTMTVPGLASIWWSNAYPDALPEDAQIAFIGTYRPITIFRGKDFGTAGRSVELLYGNRYMPTYSPATGWSIVGNKMGRSPLYGSAGFDNFYNNYTWWMEVYEGRLFVGTMDWSYLINSQLGEVPPAMTDNIEPGPGADLWQFCASDTPAVPMSLNGVQNYSNYGIRTMVSDDALYLGMANPMNLMTDPDDNRPEGGWELLKLTLPAPPEPSDVLYRINAGGSQVTPPSGDIWSADQFYSSGQSYGTSSAIAGTADDVLYQRERFGKSFSYSVPVKPGTYTVTLHFAEIYWRDPGKRVFNVDVEGGQGSLSNFDIVKEVGAYTAVVKTFPGIYVDDGNLTISFNALADNAKVSAIEISLGSTAPVARLSASPAALDFGSHDLDTATCLPLTLNNVGDADLNVTDMSILSASEADFYIQEDFSFPIGVQAGSSLSLNVCMDLSVESTKSATLNIAHDGINSPLAVNLSGTCGSTAPSTALYRINAGGSAYTSGSGDTWSADQFYSSAKSYGTSSAIAGTTDDVLYQRERFAKAFGYTIPVQYGGTYTVKLHFAEIYWTAPGKRVFNVDVEGGQGGLSNFDIVKEVGPYTAMIQTFSGIHVADGGLNINFTALADNAKVSAIEIIEESGGSGEVPDVLFRVNAGGSTLSALDSSGVAWSGDTTSSPSAYVNVPDSGNKSASTSAAITLGASVPGTVPAALFRIERWDPPTPGTEMLWSFPVPSGAYEVRLYFAETYTGAFDVGRRQFDVYVENDLVLDDYDQYADAGGGNIGVMKSFPVSVSDGQINIELRHVVENPAIKGIEILKAEIE
ncbi:malectin domain-containing carbohydrate-binding protein [Desulfococcus multivorans]|uniref:Di-glucose binding within endoplasmic reticulum n=1 Tax=Desulfococcus multivorans DSM 2059 TaxID=1121405 RepID=S7VJ53_DESML|nr:malectin domain-containing carbohydrate-binding protein [Desulfococcus multivorans]AOY60213.1 putative malectin domain protein [Desulfococcus multivorans]EPR44603.1 Di-glucose binding within endoplasmic reticulum [Desulfococcus multivorans DSM 2059]SKA06927.1 Di-glucose binding within endoplasmic reticulum [Desulfococcus multivorans DSM 2059]